MKLFKNSFLLLLGVNSLFVNAEIINEKRKSNCYDNSYVINEKDIHNISSCKSVSVEKIDKFCLIKTKYDFKHVVSESIWGKSVPMFSVTIEDFIVEESKYECEKSD